MITALAELNFRDIGGLPAGEGRRVRHGLIYRSEGPASFAPAHHEELAALGLKLICDLRADVEVQSAPHDWNTGARILRIEMTQDLRTATNEGWGALRHDPSACGARAAMRMNYAAMPAALHPFMLPLVEALIGGETPMLLNCTAGKDRTGVLVALLLSIAGVEHAAIITDYLRSDVFANSLRLGGSIADAFEKTFGFVPSDATINAMIGVDVEYLAAAFAAIDAQFRSLDEYFDTAGVSVAKIQQLRDRLLAGEAGH